MQGLKRGNGLPQATGSYEILPEIGNIDDENAVEALDGPRYLSGSTSSRIVTNSLKITHTVDGLQYCEMGTVRCMVKFLHFYHCQMIGAVAKQV